MLPQPPASTRSRTWTAGVRVAPVAAIQGIDSNEDGSLLIAGTDGKETYYSTDGGATWTANQNLLISRVGQPVYGDGKFLLGGNNASSYIWSTVDGITWQQGNSIPGFSGGAKCFTHGGTDMWLNILGVNGIPGTNITYSTDGAASFAGANATGLDLTYYGYSMFWDGTQYVCGAASAGNSAPFYVAQSPTGLDWTETELPNLTEMPQGGHYNAGLYALITTNYLVVAKSVAGLVAAVPIAIPQQAGVSFGGRQVRILANGRIVLFGSTGYVLWSTDEGATFHNDTPVWGESSAQTIGSYQVGVWGSNCAASLNNLTDAIGVRGINC